MTPKREATPASATLVSVAMVTDVFLMKLVLLRVMWRITATSMPDVPTLIRQDDMSVDAILVMQVMTSADMY